MTSRKWHHYHVVQQDGALASIGHEHADNPDRPHQGHTDEQGRRLPWGPPFAEDPIAARLRAAQVIADDPDRGKVWVPRHLRRHPH